MGVVTPEATGTDSNETMITPLGRGRSDGVSKGSEWSENWRRGMSGGRDGCMSEGRGEGMRGGGMTEWRGGGMSGGWGGGMSGGWVEV